MAVFQENVLQYFQKEIEESANEKIVELEKDIETIKSRQLKLLKEEIDDTITRAKENEINEMNVEHSAKLNRIKVGVNKEIIKRKRDLMESVLLDVTNKLLEFVKSDDYKEKMMFLIKKIDSEFCGDSIEFQVKRNDKVIKNLIKINFTQTHTIVEDEAIQLGGFRAVCLKKGIMTDQTVDASLEERKIWFFQHSKLSV